MSFRDCLKVLTTKVMSLVTLMLIVTIGKIYGNTASAVWVGNSTTANVTGSITAGTATAGSGVTNFQASTTFNNLSGNGWSADYASSNTDNDYLEFTVSPGSASGFIVEEIRFNHQWSNTTTPGYFRVYYSTDNFANSIQLGCTNPTPTYGTDGVQVTNSRQTFETERMVVVPFGKTLSVRVYVWGSTGGSYFRIDDVTISGSTAPVQKTEGLNNVSGSLTVSGGQYYTGTSGSNDNPSNTLYTTEGSHSYGVSNGVAIVTSGDINTQGSNDMTLSFRLAGMSIGSTTNGVDVDDSVAVEISPDGGNVWYKTIVVTGNNQAYWSFGSGIGTAKAIYDGDNTATVLSPIGGGTRTTLGVDIRTDGYSTVTITELPSSSNMRFRITMKNNSANERWLIDEIIVRGNQTSIPCTSPSNVKVNLISTNRAVLSWGTVSGAVSYNLQWKLSTASSYTTISGITGIRYNLTGLVSGNKYEYRVQAVCGNDSSVYSEVQTFKTSVLRTCGIPDNIVSTNITANSAKISWDALSGAINYNLEWKLNTSANYTTVSGITTTNYVLNGLTAGTGYSYRLQAVCNSRKGEYSSVKNFTTTAPAPCGVPTNLTSTNITSTSATLNWGAVSGATTYNLQWKLSSASSFTTVNNISGTSYNLTGLTAGSSYTYQIQTVCSGSNSSYSTAANFTTITPAPCGVSINLTSTNITSTSVTLNWGAVSGATTYNLQWKLSSASSFTTVNNISGTSYNLTGLTAGSSYTYQIQTVCSGSNSSYSTAANFTTTVATGPANEVVYIWSGAIQPTTATVVAKMTSASTTCRAVVSTSQSLTNPIYSGFSTANSGNNLMAKMNITGLQPNTTYYYAIESNGIVDNSADDIGKFKTPAEGPFSFKFTHGSCNKTGNHQVHTAMLNKNSLFHLQTGDLHYEDPNSTSINTHRTPYERIILSQAPSANHFKNIPIAYTWDDHDYCGNNNTVGQQTGTQSARQAYQEYVPHYPLVAGSGNVPIYQSFTIGRVHFILADLRSTRNQPGGTMFGNTQLAWFKQECLYAKNNCLMIAWITSVSWAGDRTDNWGGYTSERTSLSNWFRDNGIQNMFIMSGDAHMLAIDNGSNHDFSSGSNNPYDYPVFAAAAMNNSGSTKGGTYSQGGTFPNPSSSSGQYGLVEVTDNGGNNISFTFKGYRTSGNSTTESIVNNFTFTRTLCNAQRAVPHLSLRDLHEEKKVKLSWHIENSDDSKYVITKSNDGDKFLLLKNDIGLRGEIEDTDPSSGWNYYRVEDRDGEVKIEKKIYVSGKLGKIQISPNPASNKIRIDLENLFDFKEGHYVIFNSDNKSVLMNHINLNNSDNHFEVNTEDLSSGLYFLQLNINGMNHTEKFIISK